MHIRFASIRIVRFRSFLNEAILHFDDHGPGLYFLKGKNKTNSSLGSNGSGKSSILDSLMWCLYGKTVQGLKNPDITPWTGKGTTEVELTLFIDKTKHVVKRTVNPNKITIDGDECAQEHINKLIAIPFEIIPYTIILGQRQPLFFDLTASEKLKLFSEVLQLDRWEDRSAHAAELCKNLEKEIAAKEAELEASLNNQRQAISDFNSLKQQSSAWEAKRAEQLSNAENDKKLLQDQIAATQPELDTADLQLDRASTELKASKAEKLWKQYNVSFNEAVKYEEMLKTQVRHKARYDAELISIQDCICPTCKQETDKALMKKLRTDLTKNIKICNDQIDFLKKEIELSKQVRDQALEKHDIEEKANKGFEHDAEEARNILYRLQPRIADWKAKIAAIDKSCSENAEQANPYTDQIQTLRRRKDQVKATIARCQETIKTKTEYYERAKFWIKGFKDIRLLEVEETLQELEICTNQHLAEFGLADWQIKYDVERETKAKTVARGLNVVIKSPTNKEPVRWECWSGGEGQRLKIIGTLALGSVLLNRAGCSTNLTVYDEPTESLSQEGIQDLVELLSQHAKDSKKSVWMIDHHVVSSNKFISEITVIKDRVGSHLGD